MSDPIETIESEVERLSGSGALPMQEIEFRPTGRAIFADEAGSAEWQAAKAGGSKVDLIRTRQEAGEVK